MYSIHQQSQSYVLVAAHVQTYMTANWVPSSIAVIGHWSFRNGEETPAAKAEQLILVLYYSWEHHQGIKGEVPALCTSTSKGRAKCHLTRTSPFY